MSLCLPCCRYGAGAIVVHAPTKLKTSVGGRELQLPSMQLLTSKTASQQFLLRILKVIIQLREAARQAAKKARRGEYTWLIETCQHCLASVDRSIIQ